MKPQQLNKIAEQRLAIHAAEQPARKPNARRHGSKPTDGRNYKVEKNKKQAILKLLQQEVRRKSESESVG